MIHEDNGYGLIDTYNMNNRFHVVTVKHLCATDYKGSRVSLIGHGWRRVLCYEYADDSGLDTAIKFLQSEGCDVMGSARLDNDRDIVLCKKYPEAR